MPELDNLSITGPRYQSGWRRNRFRIDCDQGYIKSCLYVDSDLYDIDYFTVDDNYRNKGYGKEMLRYGSEHAKSVGAMGIRAYIVSRESLDAMLTVFGAEHIDVQSVGPYGDEKQRFTRARLHIPLTTDIEL